MFHSKRLASRTSLVRLIFFLFLSFSFSFSVACTAKNNGGAADSGKAGAKPNKEATLDKNGLAAGTSSSSDLSGQKTDKKGAGDDDVVTVPINIVGSYLTCAVRKEAKDSDLESEIGCVLKDEKTNKKVAGDTRLSFTSSSPETVASELQPNDSLYHVVYRIKGATRNAIIQTMVNLDAIVLYANKAIKSERVSRVLKPAIELDDFEAPIVREQTIDKDDAGSL